MGREEADWFVATGPSKHGFVSRFEEYNLNHGVNVTGFECGVYAESQDLDPNSAGPHINTHRAPPIHRVGVYGVGDSVGIFGEGNTGVYGKGTHGGPGVHAMNTDGYPALIVDGSGRGAVLSSGDLAQLRLMPHFKHDPANKANFPQTAEVGDIVAMSPGDENDVEGLVSLWLCVRKGDPNYLPKWREVQLGPII